MNENDEIRTAELWANPQFPPEAQIPASPFNVVPWQTEFLDAHMEGFREVVEQFIAAAAAASISFRQLAEQVNVELPPPPREDGRPHPPRPSTTPPMWAQNPGRTRRTRNHSTVARTPFV